MKKKKNAINIKNFWLLSLIILIAVVLAWVFTQPNLQKPTNYENYSEDNSSSTDFESRYLDFTIELPPSFQTEDETSRITINSDKGQIIVNREGTQFKNLADYLNDFDQLTTLNIISENKSVTDGDESIARLFESTDVTGGKEKIYFIYKPNVVYLISTTEPELYDDLVYSPPGRWRSLATSANFFNSFCYSISFVFPNLLN